LKVAEKSIVGWRKEYCRLQRRVFQVAEKSFAGSSEECICKLHWRLFQVAVKSITGCTRIVFHFTNCILSITGCSG
jgi:hypothetical protein